MKLGNTIKHLRKQQGILQQVLAEACGISVTYLSQIENDRKTPNLSVLEEISRVLGVPLPILFFLSLSNEDVPTEKLEVYATLAPPVRALIERIFLEPTTPEVRDSKAVST